MVLVSSKLQISCMCYKPHSIGQVDLDEVRLAADFAKILQKVGLGMMETQKSNYFSVHCGHIVIVLPIL